ncbi:alpha/beta hydrolase [Novosphingobium sp.]|uniref:alpha/beta hydrolase n=2 Tax=unclassified Novosphingobium TaxID=2644732 RepID=UPI002D1F9B80|nr:alpha/beta hydrolase [Novosphingobium sp.]
MADNREADFLRELYEDWSSRMVANPGMSIADLRSMFDEWGKPAREPEGVSYKSGEVGGVPGIWVLPQEAEPSRVILYTHGGGFAVGSADSHRKLAGHLASALDVTAFIPDYRRSPEFPFPAQIEDGIAAYLGLVERGFQPRFITTAGDSAGGNLAIAIVLRLRELGRELPGSVIAFSPWLDMSLRGVTLEANAATDALVGRQILEGMISMFLGGGSTDPLNPLANPLENDFEGFPPLYVNAGGAETLLSDAQSLCEKARGAGVSVSLSVVPGMQHVFPALAGRAREADDELQRVAAWYRSI